MFITKNIAERKITPHCTRISLVLFCFGFNVGQLYPHKYYIGSFTLARSFYYVFAIYSDLKVLGNIKEGEYVFSFS